MVGGLIVVGGEGGWIVVGGLIVVGGEGGWIVVGGGNCGSEGCSEWKDIKGRMNGGG